MGTPVQFCLSPANESLLPLSPNTSLDSTVNSNSQAEPVDRGVIML